MRRPRSISESSESGVIFLASEPQEAKIRYMPDTDELLGEGYEVDIIETISKISNLEKEWKGYFDEINAMVNSVVLSLIRDAHEDLK